jgi:predicted ATPase/DNA-binding CsgD family transcriptional regulator
VRCQSRLGGLLLCSQSRPNALGTFTVIHVSTTHPIGSAALPPIPGGLVGRGRELDRIGALLMRPSARVVNLIGPGGIGKTKLAEEVARRIQRARRTPVWYVRLAGLPMGADAAAVSEAVTASVLAEGFVGASVWDGAVQRLSALDAAGRVADTVLLLDNCEHVLAGVGAVIGDLLDAVPGLTILATSREPVGWIEEQLVVVPPLSDTQSLELFRERAELAGHPITEPGEVAVAEQVCRHMHGHPLFIRLAAARMFYEPLPMILEQLSGESGDRRMQWRPGSRVGSEDRHRAIIDVIRWSYELCGDKQQLLFDRLSVFAPGHDVNPDDAGTRVVDVGAELEAIEVVCADDVVMGASSPDRGDRTPAPVRLARTEIRELLERLVEQSLVSVHMTADSVRYFLLESLRLFASDRLAERSTEEIDEAARLARRHCYYYRSNILHAHLEWFSPAEQELLDWASGAWSNIRHAIDTSMAAGKPNVALQICAGVLSLRALFILGSLSEIRGRVEQALKATQALQPKLTEFQLSVMALMAPLALVEGRIEDAEKLLERSVAAYDAHADHPANWRDLPETYPGLPAVVDYAWGSELMMARRDPRAVTVFARAREKFRSIPHPGSEAACELGEALSAGFDGSAEQAMTIAQRHLERTTAAGAEMTRAWAQMAMAIALTKHGDPQEALQLGRAALAYLLPHGDQWGTTWAVHIRMWSLARLITDQIAAGDVSRAAVVKLATEIAYLAGGLMTQRARLGMQMRLFADETSAAEKIARDVLGDKTYAEAEKRGSGLSPQRFEVQRLALGTLSISASPVDRPLKMGASSNWQSLSKAEREVAILAAAGWPNSAIGVRRGTSTRTTDAQIASIFQKLMINSREDIVRFVPKDQRSRVSAERSRIPHHSPDKP